MSPFSFFNDTATTEIYTELHTLSLLVALPIFAKRKSYVSSLAMLSWPASVSLRRCIKVITLKQNKFPLGQIPIPHCVPGGSEASGRAAILPAKRNMS
jgi:hypothetical protein